jgi:hypothetical protein
MKIRHIVSETYIGDGARTTFAVPAGTQTIMKISVDGRKLSPGIDYIVKGRHFRPETFTLAVPPLSGNNIHVTGIIWSEG